MKKIRLGVLGTGAFAEACHVPGLQSHPDAEVVVLCGRNLARTRAMAERLGVPEFSLDYEQVCARTDIDAITIATPNVAHAIQSKAAFAAGKHVFCEKPLAMNSRESAELDGESRRYQVSVFHDLEPICSLIVLFDFLQMGGCDMPANHVIVME